MSDACYNAGRNAAEHTVTLLWSKTFFFVLNEHVPGSRFIAHKNIREKELTGAVFLDAVKC